jgi:hypothetical protein
VTFLQPQSLSLVLVGSVIQANATWSQSCQPESQTHRDGMGGTLATGHVNNTLIPLPG